jgi:hypothetical protein
MGAGRDLSSLRKDGTKFPVEIGIEETGFSPKTVLCICGDVTFTNVAFTRAGSVIGHDLCVRYRTERSAWPPHIATFTARRKTASFKACEPKGP